MTPISKNIKRLRAERGLTQEALAEMLHVTRQTVSSWENNRTQPDIDMLTALSAALDADVEELIYGKRRSVGLEAPADDRTAEKHLSATMLAVFGSLLLAAGFIILVVWLWRDMPELARRVLSFVPAAAGMGLALWAAFGKQDSQLKREAAAAVWIAGFCASVALVNHTFRVDFGFNRLLLADTLLILPVMFALDSAAAFTALNGFGIAFVFRYGEDENLPMLAFAALFLAASALYVKTNRLPAYLKDLVRWVLTGAGVTCATVVVKYVNQIAMPHRFEWIAWGMTLFACCLALLAADRETDGALPVRYPAAAVLAALPFGTLLDDPVLFSGWRLREGEAAYFRFVLCVGIAGALLIAAGIVYGRKSYRGNVLKLLYTVLSGAVFVTMPVKSDVLHVLLIAALGTVLILRGIRTLKLLPLNYGMIVIIADIAAVMWSRLSDNLPLIGGFCAALGVVMLFINKKLLTVKKEKAEKEAAGDA